jgi:peptidoglycan hydrolase-like protein with peptidoglycan-binding domain
MVNGFVALAVAGVLALPGSGGAVSSGSTTVRATGSVKAYFVLGQQLVAVAVPRATIKDAVARLTAGPSTTEVRRGVRTFVPKELKLEAASLAGHTATVDLGAAFAKAGNAAARTARLAQLVYTVSSVPGVTSVRVRIDGRAPPPGSFPRFNLTRPITRAEIARPKVKLRKEPAPKLGAPSPETRKLQQRLADLGYLPATDVDGRPGMETTLAVIAFQKWTGLPRDGVVGPATSKALATAERPLPIGSGRGKRVEVLLDRQLALIVDSSQVVLTVAVSTGKGSNATPPGSFRVFRKEVKSWSYPFQVWLPWASYFVGGIAFHEYPDVPTQAASHGCVRVPRYDAQLLYRFAAVGTPRPGGHEVEVRRGGLGCGLGRGQSSPLVEAVDPVAADSGLLTAGVGRMTGRADVDRKLRCGRTGCERRTARRAADVDEM